MKILLKLEYVSLFLIGVLAFIQTGISWWWFAAMFFLPDLSMLGYMAGSKAGAFFYNIFHHFTVGILCFVVGKYLGSDYLTVAGIILFTHSAFDRILGYGLKYPNGFHNTHLGIIGHQQ
ncbi:DUF4260 domain-containing protein [Chryseobacterium sp. VAUSW3]|uniref:DUF4260 domain-containing protein n=1 Tax=Chryseobacterium sp. VAUSW3 TaxID=2010998 RepID=UPI000B4C424A|nr:DUF4260 domain-containing protein [Chryseobacterium sp. VAUSW3]OWR15006.1 hypothetical protein CDW55_00795 [Chryseobacterium sp. VAUSW3]